MLPQLPPSLIWSDRPKGVADGPPVIERLSGGEGGADVIPAVLPTANHHHKHPQLEGRGRGTGWKRRVFYAHFQGSARSPVQDRKAQWF